jgi:hypothetical protein
VQEGNVLRVSEELHFSDGTTKEVRKGREEGGGRRKDEKGREEGEEEGEDKVVARNSDSRLRSGTTCAGG